MNFCVRCELPIEKHKPRYFRAIFEDSVLLRVIEFFCEACFAAHDPMNAELLRL